MRDDVLLVSESIDPPILLAGFMPLDPLDTSLMDRRETDKRENKFICVNII